MAFIFFCHSYSANNYIISDFMTLPGISIIFPVFNSDPHNSLACLKSISKLNYSKRLLEIIIIDNGSTNLTPKLIAKSFPQVKLIKNNSNLGFSAAVNQGIVLSSKPLVFITNDDVIFEKDSLTNLVKFLISHPKVKIAGGKIMSSQNPTALISCGHRINPWTGLIYPSYKRDEVSYPDWIHGCALLTYKSHLAKLGNLDTSYYMYFEDVQLCFSTRKLGYLVAYYPYAMFWHSESYTLNKNLYLKLYHWYKSKLIFIFKNFNFYQRLSIIFFQTLIVIPFRLATFEFVHIQAYFASLFDNAIEKYS